MGADGHIAYFDKAKVERIKAEVKEKYGAEAEVYFRGYGCDYQVNGKDVVLSYWGDNASWSEWGPDGSQLSGYDENSEAQKEFAKRITEEALVVRDQEVWT